MLRVGGFELIEKTDAQAFFPVGALPLASSLLTSLADTKNPGSEAPPETDGKFSYSVRDG